MEIAGSVAVVTGASSGIGRQAALDLAGAGARVVAVARRRERLDELVSELERRGTPGSALVCDVADPDQVAATAGRVLEAHGAADILVCAAGVPLHRAFADTPVADLDRVMRVNYLGTAAWIGALLPAMRRRRRGYVVCVASIAGAVPWGWEAGYSASKAAVVALCEAIAPELRRHGIGIGWVSPGLVRTELFDELALAHVPPAVRRTWMEPGVVSAAIVETVARERRGTTLPRVLGIPPILRQLLPGPFRAGVERTYRRSLVRPGPPA